MAGGTNFAYVEGRRVNDHHEYRSIFRFTTSGTLTVGLEALERIDHSASSWPHPLTSAPFRRAPSIHVRMQTFGTSPTTCGPRCGSASATEPATWTVIGARTAMPPCRRLAPSGLTTYLSGSATNAPVTVSVLDVTARPVQ